MKLLLTFLTITLFSFGANSSNYNTYIGERNCMNIGSEASQNYSFYATFLSKALKSNSKKEALEYDQLSSDYLGSASKLATLFNTFCKK